MDPELLRMLGIATPAASDATRVATPQAPQPPAMGAAPPRGNLPAPQELSGLSRMIEDAGNLLLGDKARKLVTRGEVTPGGVADAALAVGGGGLVAKMAGRAVRAGIPKAGQRFAVLTAENPRGMPASAAENRRAMARLKKDLDQRGIKFTPVKGAYRDETTGAHADREQHHAA